MTVADRLRRSCLAVPGSSPRMTAKAAASAADHVFIDLEDACAPSEKVPARKLVEALNSLDFGRKGARLRVNDVTTPWCYGDVLEVVSGAGANLDCLMIPKDDRRGHAQARREPRRPWARRQSAGSQPVAAQRSNSSWCSSHQWAMSMRRANQTSPFSRAYSMNSRRADVRPACPTQREWRPIDIIFG